MSDKMHPLRMAAEELSPKIRRDRGDGLYIVYGELAPSAFFTQNARREYTVLYPSEQGAQAFCQWLRAPEVFGFSQFFGRVFSREDALLLSRAIKLFEIGCTPQEELLLSRDIRKFAAEILRTKAENGGAIPICMQIFTILNQERG